MRDIEETLHHIHKKLSSIHGGSYESVTQLRRRIALASE